MREEGRDHLVTLAPLAAGRVIRTHHRDVRPDRGGPGRRLERHPVHPGDLLQELFEAPHDLEDPLDGVLVLEGVELRHPRVAGEAVIHLRAVLHGAGAHADGDPGVHADGFLREPVVVPHHVHLGQLRELRRGRSPDAVGEGGHRVADRVADTGFESRRKHAPGPGLPELEDERLVPARLVHPPRQGLRLDRPGHARTSASSAASRSMSAWLCISVTQ